MVVRETKMISKVYEVFVVKAECFAKTDVDFRW